MAALWYSNRIVLIRWIELDIIFLLSRECGKNALFQIWYEDEAEI